MTQAAKLLRIRLRLKPSDTRYQAWRTAAAERRLVEHADADFRISDWQGAPGETATVTLQHVPLPDWIAIN